MTAELAELPALLSVDQAARLLGMGTSTVYDLVRAGTFPVQPRRVGSRWKFSRAELERWLETPQDTSGP